jgi:hypothetical protein
MNDWLKCCMDYEISEEEKKAKVEKKKKQLGLIKQSLQSIEDMKLIDGKITLGGGKGHVYNPES